MDITSTLSPPPSAALSPKIRHGRSSSFSSGLLSILSPTSLVSSISSPNPNSRAGPSRWRSTSSASNTPLSGKFPNGSNSPSILAFGNGVEVVDPEEPLPTFEIQPAMLAVDLSLGPGESRSCEFFFSLGYFLVATNRFLNNINRGVWQITTLSGFRTICLQRSRASR